MSRRALDRWDWACAVAPGRLTGAQRAVLQVIARHADANGGNSFAGQDKLTESAGLSDARSVRRVLRRLEAMGLIVGELRPGKTTVWSLDFDWTPDPQVRSQALEPRTSASGVDEPDPGPQRPGSTFPDPGPTPDRPRTPRSDEGEGEELQRQNLSLSFNGSATRERANEVEFDPYTLKGPPRLP